MGDTAGALLPLLLLGLAFVVLIVLPMRDRNRAAAADPADAGRAVVGVEVMTTSGLLGRVVGARRRHGRAGDLARRRGPLGPAAIAEIRGPPGRPPPTSAPSAEPSRTDGEAGPV